MPIERWSGKGNSEKAPTLGRIGFGRVYSVDDFPSVLLARLGDCRRHRPVVGILAPPPCWATRLDEARTIARVPKILMASSVYQDFYDLPRILNPSQYFYLATKVCSHIVGTKVSLAAYFDRNSNTESKTSSPIPWRITAQPYPTTRSLPLPKITIVTPTPT